MISDLAKDYITVGLDFFRLTPGSVDGFNALPLLIRSQTGRANPSEC